MINFPFEYKTVPYLVILMLREIINIVKKYYQKTATSGRFICSFIPTIRTLLPLNTECNNSTSCYHVSLHIFLSDSRSYLYITLRGYGLVGVVDYSAYFCLNFGASYTTSNEQSVGYSWSASER